MTEIAAAQQTPAGSSAASAPARPTFQKHPEDVATQLTWTSGDQTIEYTATAGHIDIREDDGTPLASLFTISYIAAGEDANPQRPVTFCFNGGPGSSSVLINVGGLGPSRVIPNGDRRIGPAPYGIEDNPETLLPQSDLVFIDAIGTGWSMYAEGVKSSRAMSVDDDADCFARCIAAWLEKTGRWNAPLYLFGESYGTTRNAVLCATLESRGIAVNGVVMLSAIFDWAPGIPGNDLGYVQLFPTCASIAQYHGRGAYTGISSTDLFKKAADFAELELAPALVRGDRLDPELEKTCAQKMSEFLGLPVAYMLQKHLRVPMTDFRQDLLADEGLVCGRLDGRFTYDRGTSLQCGSEGAPEDDPADAATSAAWSAGFRHLVANQIGYHNARPYLLCDWEHVGLSWKHTHKSAGVAWESDTPNVVYDLVMTMRKNPHMKVLVLGGRYDLATPYLGPVEDLSRMYLSAQLKANLTYGLYDSGHMVYVNPDAFKLMMRDVRDFYKASCVSYL